MTPPCIYCGEELHFITGKGWLHPDGQLIKQKRIITARHPEGEILDNHVATPSCDVRQFDK